MTKESVMNNTAVRVGCAVLLSAIVSLLVVLAASAHMGAADVPVGFHLLANNGEHYASGWYVDGAIILEDPDDKLDIVALACCSCEVGQAAGTTAAAGDSEADDPVPQSATPGSTYVPPTVAATSTLVPTAQPTEQSACNRGVGNGSEGCDPGNSGGRPGNAGEGSE